MKQSDEACRALTREEVSQIEARKQAAVQAAQLHPHTVREHLRLSINFHITIAGMPPDRKEPAANCGVSTPGR